MRDWDNYRFFLAVAETGSLSGAARKLGVTPSTVNRRIDLLEARLNARLFDRMSHGYRLTPVGEHIEQLAGNVERNILLIERQVTGESAELSGKVIITTAEGLGSWLAPKLIELKRRTPGLDIELVIGIAALSLLRREADIALRVGDPRSDELVGRRVAYAKFGLYGSGSYLAARGEPQTPDDLANHTIIESVGDIVDLPQARLLREMAKGAAVSCACTGVLPQLAAARAGLGLVAAPVCSLLAVPGLRRVLRRQFDLALDLWLLTHRELRRVTRFRTVLDFLVEEVRRDASVPEGSSETDHDDRAFVTDSR